MTLMTAIIRGDERSCAMNRPVTTDRRDRKQRTRHIARRRAATVLVGVVLLAGCAGSNASSTPTTTISPQMRTQMVQWYVANVYAVKDYIAVFRGVVAKRSEGDPASTCYEGPDWPAWKLDPVPDKRLNRRLSDAIVEGEHTYRHCQSGFGGPNNPNDDLTYTDIERAGDRIQRVLTEILHEARRR